MKRFTIIVAALLCLFVSAATFATPFKSETPDYVSVIGASVGDLVICPSDFCQVSDKTASVVHRRQSMLAQAELNSDAHVKVADNCTTCHAEKVTHAILKKPKPAIPIRNHAGNRPTIST